MGKELIKGRESESRYKTALIGARIIQQELDDIYDVLLFGSVSRGEARPNSDIDIVVVTRRIVEWTDILIMTTLLNADEDVLPIAKAGQFNPTVISYDELQEKGRHHSFYMNILRDGVSLLRG
jgi:predicted nucleotidyltransferase